MWHKSSYSGDGISCLEIDWHTSSHSSGDSGTCVELGWRKSTDSASESGVSLEVATCDNVHVRDSKNIDGGVLNFSSGAWARFVQSIF